LSKSVDRIQVWLNRKKVRQFTWRYTFICGNISLDSSCM